MRHEAQQAMASLASIGLVAFPFAMGAVYYFGRNIYSAEMVAAGAAVFITMVVLPALYIVFSSLNQAADVEKMEVVEEDEA